MFMIFHSLYLAVYVGVNPHQDSKRACVEVFNEIVLMIFMYHLAGWNGLISDLQMQFNMGYSLISVILVTFFVNSGLISYGTMEGWRHRRAIELNRLLIIEQFEVSKAESMNKSE